MPLVETLLLGVGTGIAKGVLRLWLKDYPIADYAWGSMADVCKSLTTDILAERSALRQFEQIAERVSKNILEVIVSEGIEIAPERQEFIIRTAGEVIASEQLSPELVLRLNLDPESLTDWFVDAFKRQHSDDPRGGMSMQERGLYVRVLSESAQYIVDIASQMPTFTERTFAEVLTRENLLLTKADLILQEVRRLRNEAGGNRSKDSTFESDYRRAVVRHLDELELFGVDVSASSKRYKLSVAYVSLLVNCNQTLAIDEFDSAESSESSTTPIEKSEGENRWETVPVEQALSNRTRLFIRGDAGSGKTTLLHWVAVMAASRTLPEVLEEWNGRVPFFIRLREFSSKALPGPDDFVRILSAIVYASMPDGWVLRALENGRAIVLIDGLDEVPQARRNEVKKWIADLTSQYQLAHFLVTSRPYAADEGWLAPENFQDAELKEMGPQQIREFIVHWHEAVVEGTSTESDKAKLLELEVGLLEKLKSNRPIYRLVTTPLLCAIICALHRDRAQQLPADRIELYRACIEMFFRRDRERSISLIDYPEVGDRQKLSLLQDFAYWLIRNGWSLTSTVQAEDYFDRASKHLEGMPAGVTGKGLLRLFVERIGILREPFLAQIDFPHKTFQEYLAANAAIDEASFGELMEHATDPHWREVVILAAGIGKPTEAETLLNDLLDADKKSSAESAANLFVALACLETVVKLPEKSSIKRRVRERLSEVIPPRTVSQSKALASAGDVVVPLLNYEQVRYYKVREVVGCIRTLALIGGESAWSAIADYSEDSRTMVTDAIITSRQYASDTIQYLNFAGNKIVTLKAGSSD